MDLWAYRNGVPTGLHPAWQAGGERLHRKLQRQVREERLNGEIFYALADGLQHTQRGTCAREVNRESGSGRSSNDPHIAQLALKSLF